MSDAASSASYRMARYAHKTDDDQPSSFGRSNRRNGRKGRRHQVCKKSSRTVAVTVTLAAMLPLGRCSTASNFASATMTLTGNGSFVKSSSTKRTQPLGTGASLRLSSTTLPRISAAPSASRVSSNHSASSSRKSSSSAVDVTTTMPRSLATNLAGSFNPLGTLKPEVSSPAAASDSTKATSTLKSSPSASVQEQSLSKTTSTRSEATSSSLPTNSAQRPRPSSSKATLPTSPSKLSSSSITISPKSDITSSAAVTEASITALPITAAFPVVSALPAQTTSSDGIINTKLGALGPEQPTSDAARAGGIVAGVLLGVFLLALPITCFLYRRWRKKVVHRRSIGSIENDKTPLFQPWRRKEMELRKTVANLESLLDNDRRGRYSGDSTAHNSYMPSRYTSSASSKLKNKYNTTNKQYSFPYPSPPEASRPVTLPPPAFAPLRANRSSSVYSGSIMNGFSSDHFPPIPPRNPARARSETYIHTRKDLIMNRGRPISRANSEISILKPNVYEREVVNPFQDPRAAVKRMDSGKSVGMRGGYGDFEDDEWMESPSEARMRDSWLSEGPFDDRYSYGYGDTRDEENVVEKKEYKGKIRFGMGVQKRLTIYDGEWV